jgi:hypothetical protein
MGKWSKVKAKTIEYVKTLSIPGIPQIVTTKSYLLKLLSTVLILGTFGVGVWIISNAVSDFYRFDTITDTRWVKPDNMTFPAITICAQGIYLRNHTRNGSVIKQDWSYISDSDVSRISHFVDFEKSYFNSLNVSNHLDSFIIYSQIIGNARDCFRFNAFTNKSVGLLKASSRDDRYYIKLNNFYIEDISKNEYYNYSIRENFFAVYIGDNYLNSFEILRALPLFFKNIFHEIEIQKESTEMKLPEPYNRCKKASIDEPNHRWNCVESCIHKKVATKYNCTFPSSLFHIPGLERCIQTELSDKFKYLAEFSDVCLKECPLESCFYEKFSHITTTYLNENFPYELFNYTEFLFYFRDLSSLNISQIPKTDPFTFLNNIGGGLGLFMGIALPNVIEFLLFIFETFLILFVQKRV